MIRSRLLATESNRVPGNKLKLHIACGTVYKEGWINIDNNSDNNIAKLDLNWDLRKPLPFDSNSVDFIYHEHFLEHLTVEEGLRALCDFKRVLTPNGIMRVAMPDLKYTVAAYSDPNWKSAPWIKKFNMEFLQTSAEMINITFRWWGHQWLYDANELERRLKEARFEHITLCEIGKSKYPELCNLEIRDESTLVAEAIKEL
jgi:predicted SAM-dependent methyltransferase